MTNLTRQTGHTAYRAGGGIAIVTSLLWKYSLAPGGPLADLRHKVTKAVTWGNPMREAGRFRGDGADWDARPDTGGAMVDRLENTPSWWVDFAHKADLYTDCELDDDDARRPLRLPSASRNKALGISSRKRLGGLYCVVPWSMRHHALVR